VRIVYVEDNEVNLFLVRRIANMGGHEVIHYNDGQSVLEHFERDHPDLLLIDVQLVGALDGLDVVRSLRAAGHQTPIFAITAYAMLGDRERCLEAGCTGYIAKPLPVADLVELFKQYAEMTRQRPENLNIKRF
jgi:CheY-like chemotaxis protein